MRSLFPRKRFLFKSIQQSLN